MQKIFKTLLVTVVIASAAINSPAIAESNIWGSGSVSCSTWRAERVSNGNPTHWQQMWVLGFVSGSAISNENSHEVNAEELLDFVDNYCNENPLKKLVNATVALVSELKK